LLEHQKLAMPFVCELNPLDYRRQLPPRCLRNPLELENLRIESLPLALFVIVALLILLFLPKTLCKWRLLISYNKLILNSLRSRIHKLAKVRTIVLLLTHQWRDSLVPFPASTYTKRISKLQTAKTFCERVPFLFRYLGCNSNGICISICVPSNAPRQSSK
jgi:hypothetical protein